MLTARYRFLVHAIHFLFVKSQFRGEKMHGLHHQNTEVKEDDCCFDKHSSAWYSWFNTIRFITILLLVTGWSECLAQSQTVENTKAILRNIDQNSSIKNSEVRALLQRIKIGTSFNTNDTVRVLYYLKNADLYKAENLYDSARKYYREAVQSGIRSRLNDEVAKAYYNIGEITDNNNADSAISNYRQSIKYAELGRNINVENKSYIAIARRLGRRGDFEEANKILLDRVKQMGNSDPETTGVVYAMLASNYNQLNIVNLAEEYFTKANHYLRLVSNKQLIANNMANLTNFFNAEEKYKQALIYADSILYFSQSDYSKIFYNLNKSKAYKGLQKWDLALKYIDAALALEQNQPDKYGYAADLIMKGQLFLAKDDYLKASQTLGEAKTLFEKEKFEDLVLQKQLYRDFVMSNLLLKNPALAPDFTNYININEDLTSQSIDKNMVELEAKYNTKVNESKIARQQFEIERGKYQRNMLMSGALFIFLVGGGVFLWLNNKQKRKLLQDQNKLLMLRQNLTGMELKSLNQQLDPHEIKNLLASISPEIQDKAPDAYRKMIKLLRITKASLNNVTLTESIATQLEQARDYLELMKGIIAEPLDYEIINTLQKNEVLLPRLILKNLVENAVKHGIKGKPEGGKIVLNITQRQEFIRITVDDTGKGRKSQSMNGDGIGILTYEKLFEILNNRNQQKAELKIIDKTIGTKAEVEIPLDYKYN